MKRAETVVDGVAFVCPFCGRQALASIAAGAVFHALPTCAKFDALDVTAYLQAVNAAGGVQ